MRTRIKRKLLKNRSKRIINTKKMKYYKRRTYKKKYGGAALAEAVQFPQQITGTITLTGLESLIGKGGFGIPMGSINTNEACKQFKLDITAYAKDNKGITDCKLKFFREATSIFETAIENPLVESSLEDFITGIIILCQTPVVIPGLSNPCPPSPDPADVLVTPFTLKGRNATREISICFKRYADYADSLPGQEPKHAFRYFVDRLIELFKVHIIPNYIPSALHVHTLYQAHNPGEDPLSATRMITGDCTSHTQAGIVNNLLGPLIDYRHERLQRLDEQLYGFGTIACTLQHKSSFEDLVKEHVITDLLTYDDGITATPHPLTIKTIRDYMKINDELLMWVRIGTNADESERLCFPLFKDQRGPRLLGFNPRNAGQEVSTDIVNNYLNEILGCDMTHVQCNLTGATSPQECGGMFQNSAVQPMKYNKYATGISLKLASCAEHTGRLMPYKLLKKDLLALGDLTLVKSLVNPTGENAQQSPVDAVIHRLLITFFSGIQFKVPGNCDVNPGPLLSLCTRWTIIDKSIETDISELETNTLFDLELYNRIKRAHEDYFQGKVNVLEVQRLEAETNVAKIYFLHFLSQLGDFFLGHSVKGIQLLENELKKAGVHINDGVLMETVIDYNARNLSGEISINQMMFPRSILSIELLQRILDIMGIVKSNIRKTQSSGLKRHGSVGAPGNVPELSQATLFSATNSRLQSLQNMRRAKREASQQEL